jgi:hypothetical protein
MKEGCGGSNGRRWEGRKEDRVENIGPLKDFFIGRINKEETNKT